MKLLSRFKGKVMKSVTRVAAVLALAAIFVVPAFTSNSYATGTPTPRFNFLNGDDEMLTAKNVSKGQTEADDPVGGNYAAEAGDEIVFYFYFHNGELNSTAHNTILKATLPTAVATQHKVTSVLDSDETAPITDTVINGKIEGYAAGYSEINLKSAGRLEYIPGSTKMWRRSPNQWGTVLPDGITSSAGLNIGAIQGCWDYAGYVSFRARVKSPASIVIDKYVAYPGTGYSWSTVLENAKEGETVAWKIPVRNAGQTDANGVAIKDTLPTGLTYITGTTVYFGPDAPANGYQMPDGITANGLAINNLKPGDANVAYFVFQTKINTGLSYGSNGIAELVNTVSATYNSQTVTDSAKVTVTGKSGMAVEKKVWNGSAWVETNYINLGDHIKYQIVVSNTGQVTVCDVIVSDVIPMYTKIVSGTTKVDNIVAAETINNGGINIGSMAAGTSKVVTFEVSTYGCPPIGDYTLVNNAFAKATNMVAISDTARTIMHLAPIAIPGE